ncbi:MAG: SIR2 family protein [Sulfuricellaceae bacterium]|nr:SIR2 family protein [Sulfuricellaceae bacterium]
MLGDIRRGLSEGRVIPYIGPGLLQLVPGGSPVPASPEVLVQMMVSKVSVPHKVRNNLTAAAQFIENFKHRKTVAAMMTEAFQPDVTPSALHRYLAALPLKPLLIVDVWYDNAMETALREHAERQRSIAARPIEYWGQIQGVSQAEHFGTWTQGFSEDGTLVEGGEMETWSTILYKPLGSISPAKNYLVSDSDYVEVLTEIDIQTPIPPLVQTLRSGAGFLFLGCRFRNQLERTFARQVMKRSSDQHWAVLPGELTRNEERFLTEQNIKRLDLPLEDFAASLIGGEALESLALAG